jgi:O-acetylhomoserine (thiol)-lyase
MKRKTRFQSLLSQIQLVPLHLGACIAPDNSWMFLQGIKTLALRMDKHCSNALKVGTGR